MRLPWYLLVLEKIYPFTPDDSHLYLKAYCFLYRKAFLLIYKEL